MLNTTRLDISLTFLNPGIKSSIIPFFGLLKGKNDYFDQKDGKIHSDLTIGAALSDAKGLKANQDLINRGFSFEIKGLSTQ